jgi:hypothetical protein
MVIKPWQLGNPEVIGSPIFLQRNEIEEPKRMGDLGDTGYIAEAR